jgi:hypothetical protein
MLFGPERAVRVPMTSKTGGRTPWRGDKLPRQVWGKGLEATFLLSQARHAQSLALAVLAARGLAAPRVFVPAYYCESALGPLRRSAGQLVFYPVTPEMTPDWDGVARLARGGEPHLFVLAHYFGTENAAAAETEGFARRHGALVLEDAAHILEPVGGIGRYGDFVCYSPRKYLNVPDGAVVSVRGSSLAAEAERAAAGMMNRTRSMLGPRFALFRDRYLPWRILSGPAGALDFDADPDPGRSAPEQWMSSYTRRQIERLGRTGLDALILGELKAAERIEEYVAATTLLVPLTRLPGAVAYFLGLRAKDRAMAEASLQLLRRAGANAGTWPDMPPEVRAEPERYGAALELRNTVLRIYPRFFNRRHPLEFIGKLPEVAG